MTTVWFLLILLCLLMYVVLDGYDLGIGVATLLERDAGRRHEMLEQVAQAWDGNETWLVLLGVSLWAGFPAAFGTILPHAYLPMILMLLALIIRGVSVEMASQTHPAARWETVFGVASLAAALAQGAVVATLAGVPGALCAATAVCGYMALGYAYTKWKASGELRSRAGRRGAVSAVLATTLAATCLVAAGRAHLHGPARAIAFAGLLLFATAGVAIALASLRPAATYDGVAMVGMVTAVVALTVAVVVARNPALATSVAPRNTMTFLAVGIGLNVPLVLFYNWFAHHTFRRHR